MRQGMAATSVSPKTSAVIFVFGPLLKKYFAL
jgi:hypothetical protein